MFTLNNRLVQTIIQDYTYNAPKVRGAGLELVAVANIRTSIYREHAASTIALYISKCACMHIVATSIHNV